MSKMAQLLQIEKQMDEMRRKADLLRQSPGLAQEIAFKKDIEDVLERHNRKPEDMRGLFEELAPTSAAVSDAGRGNRKPRKLKVYLNPETNETIETRGGNHKVLKEWKSKYGSDEVESWLVEERD